MPKYKSTIDAYQLLHEGAIALAQIEHNGVKVDKDYLDKTIIKIDKQTKELETLMRTDKEVYPVWRKKYGQNINFGSRQQLASVLQTMGYNLPKTEKEKELDTEWGSKVDKAVLEKIGADVEFLSHFQRMERLKKVKGTYLEGIIRELIDHGNGNYYVHPSYNLNTVATFRSSCDNPNFQNVPVRNPEISEIVRRNYIPPDGWYFGEIDFSQIEVRIAYTYHKDPKMGAYLNDPKSDMHRDWAARVFSCEKEQVSKNMRYAVKNMFIFPMFYGSVYFQCAEQLWAAIDGLDGMALMEKGDDPKKPSGMKLKEHLRSQRIKRKGKCVPGQDPASGTFERHIQSLENELWKKTFTVYNQWKQDWYYAYQRAGGFMMKTGFAVNGWHKRNDVINYPVQGSAFHCLLYVLIKLQAWLKKYKMKTKIVGEIHDSFQFVSPDNELQDVLNYSHWLMTKNLPKEWDWINVPLDTETEVSPRGESWFKKKEWTRQQGEWRLKV